jgi:hypothetical protein
MRLKQDRSINLINHNGCRSDGLTKISDGPTLILNFKVFCEANKQDTELEIV